MIPVGVKLLNELFLLPFLIGRETERIVLSFPLVAK
jgi:hypothetical protein